MQTRIWYGLKNHSGQAVPLSSWLPSVGAGWHRLVVKLIEDLFDAGWDGEVFDIKEKFGSLRFYIGPIDGVQPFDPLIRAAEEESAKTCEICGKPGTPREKGGWIKTKCSFCSVAHQIFNLADELNHQLRRDQDGRTAKT